MKAIQEVVSPELFKLNRVVMSKKQGDQMQFPLEKRVEQRKCIHPTHQTSRLILLWNGVFDSSILLEIFPVVSKSLSCKREKTAEMG